MQVGIGEIASVFVLISNANYSFLIEGCILAISKRAYFVLSNSQMIYPLTTPKQSAAYTVRSKRHTSGDHSKLWPIEKLVTLGLIGVAPAAIINPSLVLDDALSVLLVTHMHW